MTIIDCSVKKCIHHNEEDDGCKLPVFRKICGNMEMEPTDNEHITVINEHGDIESGPAINGLKRDPGR